MPQRGFSLAALVVALDQLTKFVILEWVMDPPRTVEVTGFLDLVLVWNRGVSFGLFQSDSVWGPILLSLLSLVIIVFLYFWLRRAESGLMACAIGLVMGGAFGNLIDRIFYQAVVDFIDFHAAGYHWPAFNVADSAITIGVALLILESLFERR